MINSHRSLSWYSDHAPQRNGLNTRKNIDSSIVVVLYYVHSSFVLFALRYMCVCVCVCVCVLDVFNVLGVIGLMCVVEQER